MNIKHLQLNTSVMKEPEKIKRFIVNENVDVACFQEICYPIGGQNQLKKLVEENGYNYVEGIHFNYIPKDVSIGVGIVSKYPILDTVRLYWNADDYQPKNIKNDDFLGLEIIEDDDERNKEFEGSRGIKHSTKSRCILSTTLQTPSGIIRVVTTHFTVSDLCTETTQMFDIASLVKSYIENSKAIPTIFAGDLNIRARSYSVTKLKEVMDCHTEELKDTLSNDHIAKKKDFPNGLAIDHVFSKNIKHTDTRTMEVDFTQHKAVLSDFELSEEE